MSAVIYIRVSTTDQVENYSLGTQLRDCENYCRREGLEVEKVFEDPGVSAKNTDRPAFQQMIAYCAKHKRTVTHVIVYNVSRFSRSLLDYLTVRRQLLEYGIALRSVTETFDDSPQGVAALHMAGVWAEFENSLKAERTKAGMRAATQDGRFTHKAPLGYRNVPALRGEPNIVPDPTEARLIRLGFELFADTSKNASEVLGELTNMGLKTRKGKPLSAQTFSQILRNELYAGVINSRKLKVRAEGSFEPIIPRDLFNRAQDKLRGNGAQSPSHGGNERFPLTVFVRCKCCGKGITGSMAKRRYAYYNCRTKGCRAVNKQADVLHREFSQLLEQIQMKQELLPLLAAIAKQLWEERSKEAGQRARAALTKIEELKLHRNALVDALIRKQITREVYTARMESLEDDLQLAHKAAEDAVTHELEIDAVIAYGQKLLGTLAPLWSRLSYKERIAFQKIIFPDGITYSPETGFGTQANCSIFEPLTALTASESSLASPTGFEPVLPP